MIGRLVLVTVVAALTAICVHELLRAHERNPRFPRVTKAHRQVYGNIVSYEKFRARRLLDEAKR